MWAPFLKKFSASTKCPEEEDAKENEVKSPEEDKVEKSSEKSPVKEEVNVSSEEEKVDEAQSKSHEEVKVDETDSKSSEKDSVPSETKDSSSPKEPDTSTTDAKEADLANKEETASYLRVPIAVSEVLSDDECVSDDIAHDKGFAVAGEGTSGVTKEKKKKGKVPIPPQEKPPVVPTVDGPTSPKASAPSTPESSGKKKKKKGLKFPPQLSVDEPVVSKTDQPRYADFFLSSKYDFDYYHTIT